MGPGRNARPFRPLAHAYTDDTQTEWNGVLGRLELSAEGSKPTGAMSIYE